MSDPSDRPARSRALRPVVAVLAALLLSAFLLTLQVVPEAGAQEPNPQPPTGQGTGATGDEAGRAPAAPAADLLTNGRQLYLTSCVNCHGPDGKGTVDGPALTASGEAKADFYLRTGRMPLTVPVPQPPSKPVAFNDDQIKQLVAYVGSLCDKAKNACPPIPVIDIDKANLERGGALYLANCAPCHNSVAVGGALSYGRHAPSLQGTPAQQVAEAIRTGPGQMPRFGNEVLTDEEVNAVARYVTYLHEPETPGGFPLGYTGPVAEGFVALLLGLGALLLASRWITREPAEAAIAVRPAPVHLGYTPDDERYKPDTDTPDTSTTDTSTTDTSKRTEP